MRYRDTDIKPDKTSTVHLDEKLFNKVLKYYNKKKKISDRHVFLSEIVREAIYQKVIKIKLDEKKIKKKPAMSKRINFTLTNDLWKKMKLCADQTSKSQNDFIRNALVEYMENN